MPNHRRTGLPPASRQRLFILFLLVSAELLAGALILLAQRSDAQGSTLLGYSLIRLGVIVPLTAAGLLVPVKDAPALAQAISKLLKDAALRRSMGARGREIAERDFSARQHLREYFAVYGLAEPEHAH
jgi:glycosyltransferase involved in cell wall biosynthesis